MHTVVACLNSEGAAGYGSVCVGVNCVVACVNGECTACDVERRLDTCLLGTVTRSL